MAEGVPAAINGVEMPLVELIDSLETIAGVHGVGRIDMVENRLVGIKSREIYEAPAALVLHQAHRELEGLVIPKDLQRLKQRLSQEYADIVYNGLWFSPTRAAIDAFMQNIQPRVTGTIRLKLYKGDCRVVGRKSTSRSTITALRPTTRATRSITRPPKDSSRSGDFPSKRRRRTRGAAGDRRRHAAPRRWRSSRWQISGQDVSAASPIPSRSSSGLPFDSIGVSSKTT